MGKIWTKSYWTCSWIHASFLSSVVKHWPHRIIIFDLTVTISGASFRTTLCTNLVVGFLGTFLLHKNHIMHQGLQYHNWNVSMEDLSTSQKYGFTVHFSDLFHSTSSKHSKYIWLWYYFIPHVNVLKVPITELPQSLVNTYKYHLFQCLISITKWSYSYNDGPPLWPLKRCHLLMRQ